MNIESKVALVTGAAGGIGEACVRKLAEAGACVMATDIDNQRCAEVAEGLCDRGLRVKSMSHDVCEEADWIEVTGATVDGFGGLDILVNNAGLDDGVLLEKDSIEVVTRLHHVNVDSIFLGMKHAVLAMKPGARAGSGGSIINMSSVAGLIGVPGHSAYGSTKGAVRAYTKHAAVEFGMLGYGVRVNSVHPGLIETDMGRQVINDYISMGLAASEKEARELIKGMTALGTIGHVDDVANMVLFLASDASRYVTGAEFVVDGGLSAR